MHFWDTSGIKLGEWGVTCFSSLKNSTDLTKINGIWRDTYNLKLCVKEYPCFIPVSFLRAYIQNF